jgi:hypothetical protein
MAKTIISDMLVSKKSIRRIPISHKEHKEPEREKDEEEEEEIDIPHKKTSPGWQRKPINPKFVIWLIAAICVLALFFGLSIVFSSATIIVTPKTEPINFINEVYTTKSDSKNITDLPFEVLTVKQTAGEIVMAGEEKDVTQKATGNIVIYNNYSPLPQRLINNTRFEANNGKIYRINSSVIVPGTKKVDGKNVPGSVEATVFADQVGEDFNMKISDLTGDFKIPGFKGDPRYQSFYARIKSDITGGFVGKQRVVGADLRKSTEEIVKIKLKEQLLKELYAVLPENYIVFKDGYSVNYTVQADTPVDTNKAKINIEGTLSGIVFNNLKLAKYIATKKISNFDNLPVELVPADNLVTTFKGSDTTSLAKNSTLEMRLTGNAVIKWQYDTDALKKDIAGKKEADLKNLVAKYKDSIMSIKVIFQPVWTRYFPDDLSKIRVKEEII